MVRQECTNSKIQLQFPYFVRKSQKYIIRFLKDINKNIYTTIATSLASHVYPQTQSYLAAVQSIAFANQFHNTIDNDPQPTALRFILRKSLKDKHLVLAGDYFHIQATVLASSIKSVGISKLLAEMETNICHYIFAILQINSKIKQNGYRCISLEQVLNLYELQGNQMVKTIQGMKILAEMNRNKIQNRQNQVQQDILYRNISLLVLLKKQLQQFMLYATKTIKMYKQNQNVSTNKYNIPYYIFYHSLHNARYDVAYVNTVSILQYKIQEIKEFLQKTMHKSDYAKLMIGLREIQRKTTLIS